MALGYDASRHALGSQFRSHRPIGERHKRFGYRFVIALLIGCKPASGDEALYAGAIDLNIQEQRAVPLALAVTPHPLGRR
jgi:hypothetical protein